MAFRVFFRTMKKTLAASMAVVMLISTGAVSVFANTTVEEQNTAQSTVTESTEDNAG